MKTLQSSRHTWLIFKKVEAQLFHENTTTDSFGNSTEISRCRGTFLINYSLAFEICTSLKDVGVYEAGRVS